MTENVVLAFEKGALIEQTSCEQFSGQKSHGSKFSWLCRHQGFGFSQVGNSRHTNSD
jgi:hypothetical protein